MSLYCLVYTSVANQEMSDDNLGNSQKIKHPIGCAKQRAAHRFISMMRFTIVQHIL